MVRGPAVAPRRRHAGVRRHDRRLGARHLPDPDALRHLPDRARAPLAQTQGSRRRRSRLSPARRPRPERAASRGIAPRARARADAGPGDRRSAAGTPRGRKRVRSWRSSSGRNAAALGHESARRGSTSRRRSPDRCRRWWMVDPEAKLGAREDFSGNSVFGKSTEATRVRARAGPQSGHLSDRRRQFSALHLIGVDRGPSPRGRRQPSVKHRGPAGSAP